MLISSIVVMISQYMYIKYNLSMTLEDGKIQVLNKQMEPFLQHRHAFIIKFIIGFLQVLVILKCNNMDVSQ
jgi:hypothetical protein